MKLNELKRLKSTTKNVKRVGRGIGSGKEKHLEVATKDKKLDQVLQLMDLKVGRCLYIEDFQNLALIT